MRPILRPGSHVLRRDDRTLQVGLDPHTAVVLSDGAEVRGCLDLLSKAAEREAYDAPETLDLLTASDHVLDSGALMPLIPGWDKSQEVARADVAALARSAGDDAPALLQARHGCRAGVASFGNGRSGELSDDVRRMLRAAGFRVTATGQHDLMALVGVGEPHRERVDGWIRDGTPHLLVRLAEGGATLGPFVLPGQTACLRCLDAHHTDADPCWPLLVAQYASLTSRERPDGVPEPVDGMVATLAMAWAARDLTSFAEGRRPSTWSTTIRFDAHLTSIETRTWLRHPDCGCGWG